VGRLILAAAGFQPLLRQRAPVHSLASDTLTPTPKNWYKNLKLANPLGIVFV
jgi:hypothetical protein